MFEKPWSEDSLTSAAAAVRQMESGGSQSRVHSTAALDGNTVVYYGSVLLLAADIMTVLRCYCSGSPAV